MRLLYNLLFACFFLLFSPYYFLRLRRRGAWKKGFGQRFGFYEDELQSRLQGRKIIWFHAVSVGEVNLSTMLIHTLIHRFQDWDIVASTTTTTGITELRRRLPKEVFTLYYPIDFLPFVNRALRVIHPTAVVLIEAEIWPNLLWQLSDRGTPVFLVNARLSNSSAKWYGRAHFLFGSLFKSFTGVGAQDQTDAEMLQKLGCIPDRVKVNGNLKFDAATFSQSSQSSQSSFRPEAIVKWSGARSDAIIFLGSSTHSGEEKMLAEIYLRLKKQLPNLFLILVPRHCERRNEVCQELMKMGIRCKLRSEFQKSQKQYERQFQKIEDRENHNDHYDHCEISNISKNSNNCLLVDSTGELQSFYKTADVVFIGKSMFAFGGQNPIEAAASGCAILAGPHMENFRAITQTFLASKGIVQVQNADELEAELEEILLSNRRRSDLAREAKAVVEANRGALTKTITMIESQFS